MRAGVCVVLALLVWISTANGTPALRISLKFNKAVYHIGEQMRCDIIFSNASDRALRFIPIDVFVDAAELRFEGTDSELEKTILYQGERLYDIDDLVKDAVVLLPRQSYTRQIRATVRGLPCKESENNGGSIALDYGSSTLVISKFGKYSVTKKFQGQPEWLRGRNAGEGPPFWTGDSMSPPVSVTFAQK